MLCALGWGLRVWSFWAAYLVINGFTGVVLEFSRSGDGRTKDWVSGVLRVSGVLVLLVWGFFLFLGVVVAGFSCFWRLMVSSLMVWKKEEAKNWVGCWFYCLVKAGGLLVLLVSLVRVFRGFEAGSWWCLLIGSACILLYPFGNCWRCGVGGVSIDPLIVFCDHVGGLSFCCAAVSVVVCPCDLDLCYSSTHGVVNVCSL
ncbi:unnamed protein product [Amaranthus hypochondriacus]